MPVLPAPLSDAIMACALAIKLCWLTPLGMRWFIAPTPLLGLTLFRKGGE